MKQVTVIGSSPISVIEAIFRQEAGEQVTILEAKKIPGGAWGTVVYQNLPEIEVGCHIWSYNDRTYKFLEEVFNLELNELLVQPKMYYKGKFLPYDWKQSLISAKKLVKACVSFKRESFTILRNSPDFRLGVVSSHYSYPKNGALDLKNSLINLIDKHRLNVNYGSNVYSISLVDGKVELTLLDQNEIHITDCIVLTSLSEIKSVTLEDGTVIVPDKRKVEYIHRHLLIDDVDGNKFSYIRCLNHPLVHRISDMTSQVNGQLKVGQKLICVGVFEKEYYKVAKSDQENQIMELLKKMKLIGKDANLVVSESNVYPSFYSDADLMDQVQKKTNGKISFLRSTDFVYSFYNQLDKYEKLLSRNTN